MHGLEQQPCGVQVVERVRLSRAKEQLKNLKTFLLEFLHFLRLDSLFVTVEYQLITTSFDAYFLLGFYEI